MNKKSNIFNEPDFPGSRGLRRGTTGRELLLRLSILQEKALMVKITGKYD